MNDAMSQSSTFLRMPLSMCFSNEYITWFTEFQYDVCWLWSKEREPGGLSHPDAKPFHTLTDHKVRFMARILSMHILDYLSCRSLEDLLHLEGVGKQIYEIGAALDEGELVEPLKGIPLRDGSRVYIKETLLNELAFAHHSGWLASRNLLNELALLTGKKYWKAPKHHTHVEWDIHRPDSRWNRDRGNIFGTAFGLAVMPEERREVIFNSTLQ